MKCLQCHSGDLVEDVRILDYSYQKDLVAVTHKRPEALLFKQSERAPVRARICAECGFAMLYVDPKDAEKLRGRLKKNK